MGGAFGAHDVFFRVMVMEIHDKVFWLRFCDNVMVNCGGVGAPHE